MFISVVLKFSQDQLMTYTYNNPIYAHLFTDYFLTV